MRATYFTVTGELLRSFGIRDLESDDLNALFQMPLDVFIFNIYQDWRDWQTNQFKVAIEGTGLPEWAEKKEGELMTPCEPKISKQEDGSIQWEFVQDTSRCKECGGYR